MLRDWLAADFLCDVFIIVLRLVSVAILWFAHALVFPVVGYALLPAVGYDLLPAVACALLPAVNYALSDCFHPCSKSSMLFSCGPRALVSFSLLATTGSLAVVLSLLFFLLAWPPPALLWNSLLFRGPPHAPPTTLFSLRRFVIIVLR